MSTNPERGVSKPRVSKPSIPKPSVSKADAERRAFGEAVREVITALQPGELVTYGEVAAEAGYPGAARAVGRVLRDSSDLPWWRVVNAAGRLVPGNEQEHARRLRGEGIASRDGRVVRG